MKKSVWVIVFLLLVSAVSASDFIVNIGPEVLKIKSNETAEFTLTLIHDYANEQLFSLYSPDVVWDIRTEDTLRTLPHQLLTTKLIVRPLNVNPGLYGIPIHVKRTGTNEIHETQARLELISPFPPAESYLPAIRGYAGIAEVVDPRQEVEVVVHLVNQNKRDLKKIFVKVRSEVINQDFETSLGPGEEKTARFKVELDVHSKPQDDVLFVTVIAPEKDQAYQFDFNPVKYKILKYGQIDEKPIIEKEFFKITRTITLENNANTVQEADYTLDTNFITNIFTKTLPKAEKRSGKLFWDVKIGVGHSFEIIVITNYRPLLAVLAVIVIAIICYFIFRSPIAIKKSATVVSTKEGGVSELKVLLELTNRSRKDVKNVKIIDLVPRIADFLKKTEPGSIIPSKVVRHEHKGTIVKWEIDKLLAGEERIISYKLKSRLSILGGVTLPTAVAKFTTEKGKHRTSGSNAASLNFVK